MPACGTTKIYVLGDTRGGLLSAFGFPERRIDLAPRRAHGIAGVSAVTTILYRKSCERLSARDAVISHVESEVKILQHQPPAIDKTACWL
jgi:hypothetical protein